MEFLPSACNFSFFWGVPSQITYRTYNSAACWKWWQQERWSKLFADADNQGGPVFLSAADRLIQEDKGLFLAKFRRIGIFLERIDFFPWEAIASRPLLVKDSSREENSKFCQNVSMLAIAFWFSITTWQMLEKFVSKGMATGFSCD